VASPEKIEIRPRGPIDASVRPPGSKSLTNRALVCAALADGISQLTGALDSEDTRVMVAALQQLGIAVKHDPRSATIDVIGRGGKIPVRDAELYLANSGTSIRFLSCLTALGKGQFVLDGNERMQQRPIGDLIDALRSMDVRILDVQGTRCPPLVVHANGLKGGTTTVRGDISSQFLSGLLMVAPYAKEPVTLNVEGELVSKPYVDMTVAVMRGFGVEVREEKPNSYFVKAPQRYQARLEAIEPDASAASYFLAAAAITGGVVRVEGLSRHGLQGDVAFADVLEQMGCDVTFADDSITVRGGELHGIDVDMNPISDTVQTLAAVALFAAGPTRIRGVGHIRHKETDRIGDLARELIRLGAEVQETDDGMTITPAPLHAAEIHTYDDHRMAMSLALVGLRVPGVVILDPDCTSKTYPRYFEDLARACESQ
jgi:3-phosphoshikimate 1-carboxyvinyltransferase